MASRSFADVTAARASPGPIPLAHREAFALGAAMIRPALRMIAGSAGGVTVEPRVMQVILALADASGEVLTREDLLHRCWPGVVVGGDSVNRAIAEARRAIRTANAGLAIETIARVGYRLVIQPDAPAPAPCAMPQQVAPAAVASAPMLGRRHLIGAAAAFAAVAFGGWEWRRSRHDPRTRELIQLGRQAVRDELPESDAQGVGFLREAVAREPGDAAAWGLLALACRGLAENARAARVAGAVRDCEAAAARALALDRREGNALAARALLPPVFGDWAAAEDRLTGLLAVASGNSAALGGMVVLAQSVGRDALSAHFAQLAVAADSLSPAHQYRLAYKHWIAGRTGEADRAIDRALLLWPRHPSVWFARLLIFAFTGRTAQALAQLGEGAQAGMIGGAAMGFWTVGIRALSGGAPTDFAAFRAVAAQSIRIAPIFSVFGIQFAAAMGDLDHAFALAEGYYLRRGPMLAALARSPGAPAAGDQRDRKTMALFTPPGAALRADARFDALTRDIGLAAYWRARGIAPDYRARLRG